MSEKVTVMKILAKTCIFIVLTLLFITIQRRSSILKQHSTEQTQPVSERFPVASISM